MSQNKDFITDQEMDFARLVLAGTMTDKQAAKTVGLNPHSAAYIKGKPSVRAYMQEHRALMQERLAQQQAEQQQRTAVSREQILARLWEIANAIENSAASQVKALALMAAIEGLIPDRRAAARGAASDLDNKPAAPPATPKFYVAEWLRQQQTTTPPQEEDRADPPAEATPSAKPDAPGEPAQAGTTNSPQRQQAHYESFVPDAWRR